MGVHKKQNELQWQNSQKSNPSTLWLLSTSPRKNGTNSPALSPRPLDSLWPRLLPSLMSLTPSSANTTDSPLDSNMSPTWMLTKSRETSPMMSQYTLSEFALDDPSKDSVCPLESPSNNVLTWKNSWLELSLSSLVIFLATTIH